MALNLESSFFGHTFDGAFFELGGFGTGIIRLAFIRAARTMWKLVLNRESQRLDETRSPGGCRCKHISQ